MGSVRGERVVYRESERDFDEAPRRTYTTIKRYQVPEAITKSVYQEDDEVKDKIIIKRDSRGTSRDTRREDVEYRFSERERDPAPRRDIHYRVVERDSDFDSSRSEFRVLNRESVRAPSPPVEERERVYRFERERDFSPVTRERDYDVERYSKSTEYYQQPQPAPQPIIIRESAPAPIIIRETRREPIIIREERREPQYEFVEKKEEEIKEETKSLVTRERTPEPTPEPPPQKQEDDYFYERRVVERRRERTPSPEVRPRDSASQYSSDDSYEYMRRETITEGDERSHSPHHKRHLAEGAIAGIGAAEIIRRHRKKQGESAGHRGRDLIGGAAVGALGAEALSRVRSMRSLRRSSRSTSGSRERHGHGHKHSRSHSLSRTQQLGGLAAVAAIGALAGYAINKNRNKETVIINDRPHRSRSRRRRSRHASTFEGDNSSRDPDHRNRRIAQAGLASAAAAGVWEKVRSRSRGGKSRSRSRLRQGIPIAAAGLGGAALAGLYEKNKANKDAKRDAIVDNELNRGRGRHSRSRSRSKSRSVAAPYPTDSRSDVDRGMIAYGNEPIYPSSSRVDYYSDEEPGVYRRRRGSSGSSPDTRRRHSRSRSRGPDARRKYNPTVEDIESTPDRSSPENRNDQPYNGGYQQNQSYNQPPMGHNAGYNNGGYAAPQQQQAYQNAPYFPPPPTGEAQAPQAYGAPNPHAQYNPADFAGQPHDGNRGFGDAGQQQGSDQRRGADPENVSVSEPPSNFDSHEESQAADGLASPNLRSSSHVHFDLASNTAHSPEISKRTNDPQRNSSPPFPDSELDNSPPNSSKHSTRSSSSSSFHNRHRSRSHSPNLMHDQYDRAPTSSRHRRHRHHHHRHRSDRRRGGSNNDSDSEGTIELPSRFDDKGNRKAEDPLAQSLNDLLSGKGGAAGLFKSIADNFLGGGHVREGEEDGKGEEEDDDDNGGVREERRRRRSKRR